MVEPIAKKQWDEIIFCTIDKDDVERFPVYADYIWLASFEATWSSFAIRTGIVGRQGQANDPIGTFTRAS
jgi:hypothetical protein